MIFGAKYVIVGKEYDYTLQIIKSAHIHLFPPYIVIYSSENDILLLVNII